MCVFAMFDTNVFGNLKKNFLLFHLIPGTNLKNIILNVKLYSMTKQKVEFRCSNSHSFISEFRFSFDQHS
jgi:hypothetical protein